MALRIIAKVGTIPYGRMRVKSKRLYPKVGDFIYAKKDGPRDWGSKWKRFYVAGIIPESNHYFLTRA